jgi:hypothetical protein
VTYCPAGGRSITPGSLPHDLRPPAALQTPDVSVAKVLISQRAQGAPVDAIVQAAQAEAVPVERVKDEW